MPNRREARLSEAAASGDEDRISALPDDILHLVLSSLPSDDAVRTCVLAKRWSHLWKSARALRIYPRKSSSDVNASHRTWTWGPWTPQTLRIFVHHLLLLRGGAPLDVCDIACGELWGESGGMKYEETNQTVGLWIRHAMMIGRARALRVCFRDGRRLCLDKTPFVSETLRTVELNDVTFYDKSVDFSRCPALKKLKMNGCKIHGKRIFQMSKLVTANVTLEGLCEDKCTHHGHNDSWLDSYSGSGNAAYLESLPSCGICCGSNNHGPVCFLKAYNFGALVYFLRCSPILQKLTVRIGNCETRHPVVNRGDNYSPIEQSLVSNELKVVEIQCLQQNALVEKLITILVDYGVQREQINIEQNLSPLSLSGYETWSDDDEYYSDDY
ncbi:hypothetical protein PR202_gb16257 [Eleusine coracana subsp. coracana]|uniref:F-box domain-containing protein n=1 Tax=Eleusine coracana subsp. coracana TaxID=191504 RepID=A0AAV5EXP3_ELECO|nr:hypothetical protein PR202_gb16257 [Eleusine coracana subsp. coracana]